MASKVREVVEEESKRLDFQVKVVERGGRHRPKGTCCVVVRGGGLERHAAAAGSSIGIN